MGDTKAGAASQYTVSYTTSASGTLAAGGGQIIFKFPEGTTVPSSISSSNISVTTNANITPATKTLVLAPSIDVITRTVTMTTPIVIGNDDVITIIISSTAGLKNPLTPGSYGTTASGKPFNVTTSVDTVTATPGAAYSVAGFVSFSPTAGAKRGETVTVTAGGLATNTTGSITMGTSSVVLGNALIDTSGNFTGTFIATVNTKDGGKIVVTDGAGKKISSDATGCTLTCVAASTPLYAQKASATPRQTTVSPPVIVEVDLFDFTVSAGNEIANTSTTLGGTTLANSPAAAFSLAAGANESFQPYKILVPTGTTTGTKTVVITESGGGGSKSASFSLTISAAAAGTLTLIPSTTVAGKTVAISGSGFSSVSVVGGDGPNGVH